jgi:hypothetical protein
VMELETKVDYFDAPIILDGELTPADVRTAIRLAGGSKRRLLLGLIGLTLFVVLFVTLGLLIRPHHRESGDRVLLTALIAPTLIAVPVGWHRYRLHQARKNKTGVFDQRGESTISDDGFCFRKPNAESQLAWDLFTGFRRNDCVVVLFFNGSWMYVAKSRFSNIADWNRFVSFVDRYVPAAK